MKCKLFSLFVLIGLLALAGLPAVAQDTAVGAQWKSMDKDGDGKITKDEATGLMKQFFDRNDANKDGFLDEGELADLAKRLEANRGRANQQRGKANANRNQQGPMAAEMLKNPPAGVTVVPDIAYREGNDAWKLDLAMPEKRGDAPRPAIVFVHGGGWRNGDKRTPAFTSPTLEFAARGYVCINVNYRLGGPKRDCVEDVKCAVRWLRAHAKKYNVDPRRFGAYGNSAGAHLVTMLGVCPASAGLEGDGPWREHSSMVQTVVASATPTVPRAVSGDEEEAKLIRPMSYVSVDVPPFLLIHEESDRTVPVSNSDNFVKALKEAGAKDINYIRLTDGSGHGAFRRNIKTTGPAREAFFKRTLMKK